MHQQQLPPECILIIIRFVHNNSDTDTMASLLRVNKTICAATLTFLYRDCFGFIRRRLNRHYMYERQWLPLTLSGLVRTLLGQVHPQSRIPDILKVAFLSPDNQTDLGPTAPPPPHLFKYWRFLSTVDVEFEVIRPMFQSICDSSPLMGYAATNRLYEKYKDVDYIANYANSESKDRWLRAVLRANIYQELIWMLCQDHPESIDSLTIPLKDIQRYIDHVHLFTSLSSVKFSIRVLEHIRQYGYGRYHTNDPTRGIEETERNGFFRSMGEFVRQHTSIHKNVLQNVEVPSSSELYKTDQHSIPDVYYAIQSLLPSFQNLRSITTGRIELLARPTNTSPGLLESITVLPRSGSLQAVKISELLRKHPPFLPRYRPLKHLTTETLGPDMFQWAVLEKEKKQQEAELQLDSIVGRHMSSQQHEHHTSDLVRLQSINISNKNRSLLIQELDDIAFAFSDSLEEWRVEDGFTRHGGLVEEDDDASRIIHGQGWDLPRLRSLSFELFGVRLHFDMDGLGRCRALESLTLHDNLTTYRRWGIRSWPVVCLPHLKKLDLKGSPALHFDMDSLHNSPCLEELTMEMTHLSGGKDKYWQYHIPPLEGLEYEDSDTEGVEDHESSGMSGSSQAYQSIGGRPQYTWDWHPSKLRKLDLAAVFALMFDFRWLQHLPNLQSLRLNISSPVKTAHRRQIALKDLLKREPQQASDESVFGEILSGRSISLPKLESIELNGDWIFEDKVMDTLCMAVALHLCSFSYNSRYAGLTLSECIALSRKMPRLKKIQLRTLPTWEDPCRLGLEPEKSAQYEQLVKGVVFAIDGQKYYLASRKSG
ncbi:MAG: hypothetical protein J3Q66DRAFT_398540 [Benniella sp.]|nr:MAG: hypothetical protein J3Q66DRAFT_398540 [Benniella sp.]